MEPIDTARSRSKERSVTAMPLTLLAVAAVALLVRSLDVGISLGKYGQSAAHASKLSWEELPRIADLPKMKKAEFKPAVQEFAPETIAELNKLLEQGRSQNKYLLYEFCAAWSDPCKKMESLSLENAQISEIIDAHFKPVKIVDKQKELGKNPRLVADLHKKYRVFAFPTLVVADERGEPVASLIGNCSSLTTYRFLSRALYSLRAAPRPVRHLSLQSQ